MCGGKSSRRTLQHHFDHFSVTASTALRTAALPGGPYARSLPAPEPSSVLLALPRDRRRKSVGSRRNHLAARDAIAYVGQLGLFHQHHALGRRSLPYQDQRHLLTWNHLVVRSPCQMLLTEPGPYHHVTSSQPFVLPPQILTFYEHHAGRRGNRVVRASGRFVSGG